MTRNIFGWMWRLGTSCIVLAGLILPAAGADWDPKLAATYLDARQQQWFEWKSAQASGGPCVSCHTGLPYLLARPQLRKALGEQGRTRFEQGLVEGLTTRLASGESMFRSLKEEPLSSQGRSVEAVLTTVALGIDPAVADGGARRAAWNRLWSIENLASPNNAATWPWFNLKLHPYESEASAYFGAALVAIAGGLDSTAAHDDQSAQNIRQVKQYLREGFPQQPVHNQLMALWASGRLPGMVDRGMRSKLLRQLWRQQQSDGGWQIAALGPWSERPAKPESSGSNAYATALVIFTLEQAGAGCGDPRAERGRTWLRSHQDPQTGVWFAPSMNKLYPQGSMQEGFMSDAATSYAVLALLDPGKCR